jgi:hypothetical protein
VSCLWLVADPLFLLPGNPGDVVCQSHCITVPSPDSGAVNRTNECVAACPVGTGTASDNQAYATCVSNCIGQYYYTESVGTPTGTAKAGGNSASGGSSATSATVTNIVSTVTSGSSTFATTIHSTVTNKASGTGASASASSTSSGNAADAIFRPATSSFGLLGFIAALLAL